MSRDDEDIVTTAKFPALRRYLLGSGKWKGYRRLNTVGGSQDCGACAGTGKDRKGNDCKTCAGTGTATDWK